MPFSWSANGFWSLNMNKGVMIFHTNSLPLELEIVWTNSLEEIENGLFFEKNPGLIKNYTRDFYGVENHAWLLKEYELYMGSDNTYAKAVCILTYDASNPDFIHNYCKSITNE
jgi:hypothetical protein